MADNTPMNNPGKQNLNNALSELSNIPNMLKTLNADVATIQTIQQALISGDNESLKSLLDTELKKITGESVIAKMAIGSIARVIDFLNKNKEANISDRKDAQAVILSDEKQKELATSKETNSTDTAKVNSELAKNTEPKRDDTQSTKDVKEAKENRDAQTYAKSKDNRATGVYPSSAPPPTGPVERTTAENVEKSDALAKNKASASTEVEPGIEVRNVELQRDVLRDTIDNVVKRHVLGRDPTGHMNKHMYNSFKQLDVTGMVGFRRAHIFITTPNCNIFKKGVQFYNAETGGIVNRSRDEWYNCLTPEIQQDPTLAHFICDGNIDVAMYLDSRTTFGRRRNIWCYPLMNLARSLSGLPNMDLKTRQGPNNFRNNYTEMVVNSAESISANNINLVCNDDKDCTIARMMYIWTRYAESVGSGLIQGREARNKEIDYMSSIYIFVTDETNMQLKFSFAEIGCFPRSRSYDFLSLNFPSMKDKSQLTIPFKVTFPLDMDPLIPAMFNRVTSMQDKEDDNVVLGTENVNYDFTKGNAAGINPMMKSDLMTIAGYYSDMFYITSIRPYRDPKTNKMVTRLAMDTKTVTNDKGRIPYYLVMVNRSNTLMSYDENGDPIPPKSTSHPYTDKYLIKESIATSAANVSIIQGNPENVIMQKISGEYSIRPSGGNVPPRSGPTYSRILDSKAVSYIDKLKG